jgi:23S rRNA pseudouridine2605 synthase
VKERLQKLLARAGYGSRRSAENLIVEGRVSVNGTLVRQLGTQVDDNDRVEVDGIDVSGKVELAYLAMHKPPGVVTTARDPQRRRTVMELLPPDLPPHVLPVGRLDRDTEGLLLFTLDGELADRLAHPRYAVEKEYLVQVEGTPNAQALEKLRKGVLIDDRPTEPAIAEFGRPPEGYSIREGTSWVQLVIHEGRKRQVRLMLAAVGHSVITLVRTRIDGITLARLARGTTRRLAPQEVSQLRRLLKLEPAETAGVTES